MPVNGMGNSSAASYRCGSSQNNVHTILYEDPQNLLMAGPLIWRKSHVSRPLQGHGRSTYSGTLILLNKSCFPYLAGYKCASARHASWLMPYCTPFDVPLIMIPHAPCACKGWCMWIAWPARIVCRRPRICLAECQFLMLLMDGDFVITNNFKQRPLS